MQVLTVAQDPLTLYMDADDARIIMGPMEAAPIILRRTSHRSLSIDTIIETDDVIVGNSTYSQLVQTIETQQAQLASTMAELSELKTLVEQIQTKYNLQIP